MSTNAEMMVTFSPVFAEIFGKICRFLPSPPKSYRNSRRNLWVSEPIAIKPAQNVVKILLFNTCKSKLRYSNTF